MTLCKINPSKRIIWSFFWPGQFYFQNFPTRQTRLFISRFTSFESRSVQRSNTLYNAKLPFAPAFLPSKLPFIWSPELAIQNSTNNLIRADHSPSSTRWVPGNIPGDSTVIKALWEHTNRLKIYADPTMGEQLYRGSIQYIYFFIRKSFFFR